MKTIIVDDEIMAIKLVRNYLERDKRVEIVGECLDAGEALQCVRERAVEAAFLDICIHGCMDGVELGKKLKELNPQIVLIYTTGNAQYVDNAIDVEADFYLMKPLNAAELTFVVKKANELALQIKESLQERLDILICILMGVRLCFAVRKQKSCWLFWWIEKEGL